MSDNQRDWEMRPTSTADVDIDGPCAVDPFTEAVTRIRMGEANAISGHPTNALAADLMLRRFATGAVRSADAEATRYDLVSPIGLAAVAATCAEGARKYSDFNWEKGMPVHDLLNHALKHIYNYLSGDRSEPHLPHAAWGLLAAIHSEALWPHLNEGHLRGPGCAPPADPIDARNQTG